MKWPNSTPFSDQIKITEDQFKTTEVHIKTIDDHFKITEDRIKTAEDQFKIDEVQINIVENQFKTVCSIRCFLHINIQGCMRT